MERTFTLTLKANGFSVPDIRLDNRDQGTIAFYPTPDTRISHVVIIGKFQWPNRKETEVFRCTVCSQFIFPGEWEEEAGEKYHHDCFRNMRIKMESTKADILIFPGVEKECPVCHAQFIDESLDGRHDYCRKCEDDWEEDQKKTAGWTGEDLEKDLK